MDLAGWLKDGGLASRKFIMSAAAYLLILGGAFLAAWRPSFAGVYEVFVGGVIGVLTAYLGGNVTARWAAAKHVVSKMADGDGKSDPDEKA